MKTFIYAIAGILLLAFTFNGASDKAINNTKNEANGSIDNDIIRDTNDFVDVSGPLKDVSNMFNERGYYKSNGFSFDEQEIINDFNGNLIYNIPLYNYKLPGDLQFDVALTYNGSVGHQYFTGTTLTYYEGNFGRYNVNLPEWIISIDGIAVQVPNFETNFFSNISPEREIIQGDSVHALIPGYHFDNQLIPADIEHPDIIQILAGDGSTISLINDARNGSYEGTYSYVGKELFYKARVTFTETTGLASYKNRRIELMKGDGLIFIFEEKRIDYFDFSSQDTVQVSRKPKVIMLKAIKDRYNNTINLSYSLLHPYQEINILGRPLLASIDFDFGFSTSPGNSLNFLYGPRVIKIEHSSTINGNYTFKLETPVAFRPVEQVTFYRNHRGTISEITNILGQTDFIKYKKYVRTFTNVIYPHSGNKEIYISD